jgi:hypothetical protein
MTRKVITMLVDDLDGTTIDDGAGETIAFSVGDSAYEIDLSEENAKNLRAALAPFISAARPAPRARRTSGSRASAKASPGVVRAWLQENGHEVPSRGRIPAALVEIYEAAAK